MMADIFRGGVIATLAFAGLHGYAQTESVIASKFGWNSEDATECLRSALRSGAKTIRIDKQASHWVLSSTVRIPSNVEVVLEDGVVIKAKSNCFKGLTDSLLAVIREKNITLRGEGTARLVMNKADYFDSKRYRIGEWRHAINLMNTERLVISNLTIEASGGDGVYVNGCKLGLIDKVTAVGNARQGVSIISADKLMIRNSRFLQTKGVNPQCGIDIEPHVETCWVKKVIIENCEFRGNAAHGFAINVSGMSDKSEPISVTLRNCTMAGNGGYGIWALLARASHAPVKGIVRFENCRVEGNAMVPLDVSNLCVDALAFDFKNCIFDAGNKPVAIRIKNGTVSHDVGDISFGNCKVVTARKSQFPASFAGSTGVGVVGARGKLEWQCGTDRKTFDMATLVKKHPSRPELKNFSAAACELKNLVPVCAKGKKGAVKTRSSPMIRGAFSFVQRTPGGGEFPIVFKGMRFGQPCEVSVFDQAGTPHDTFTVNPGQTEYKYILKTRAAHVFRFDVQPRGGMWTVHSETPGHGILMTSRVPLFVVRNHDMYFSAPAGAREVVVELSPSDGEHITAELIAPDGTVCDRCDKSSVGVLLRGRCTNNKNAETWRLRGVFFLEDGAVRLGGDAVPVVAFDPDSVLNISE